MAAFLAYITAYANIFLTVAAVGFIQFARRTEYKADALFCVFLTLMIVIIMLFFS